jgi:hypothetical protein
MVNYMSARGGTSDDDHGTGHLLELGAGYYVRLGGKFVFEVYGGFGDGRVKNDYYAYSSATTTNEYTGFTRLQFNRYFVQPNIGFTTPYFDVAFSPRFCMLHYKNGEQNGSLDMEDARKLIIIGSNRNIYLFEPGLTVRGGWRYIKGQLQVVTTESYNTSNDFASRTNISIGIFLSFSEKYFLRKRRSSNQ